MVVSSVRSLVHAPHGPTSSTGPDGRKSGAASAPLFISPWPICGYGRLRPVSSSAVVAHGCWYLREHAMRLSWWMLLCVRRVSCYMQIRRGACVSRPTTAKKRTNVPAGPHRIAAHRIVASRVQSHAGGRAGESVYVECVCVCLRPECAKPACWSRRFDGRLLAKPQQFGFWFDLQWFRDSININLIFCILYVCMYVFCCHVCIYNFGECLLY